MRELTREALLNMGDSEDIYVVTVSNGIYILEADLENSDEHGFRIELFGDVFTHNKWVMDNDVLQNGIEEASEEVRGRMCGGIYFVHEDEPETMAVEQLLEIFWYAKIFQIESKEVGKLPNGTHIIVVRKDEDMTVERLLKLKSEGNTEEILRCLGATDIGQGYGYKDFYFDWENGNPDKIIYIPEYGYEDELPITEDCYTKQMFIDICGDSEKAKYLFDGVDWQFPETLYDEYEREGGI